MPKSRIIDITIIHCTVCYYIKSTKETSLQLYSFNSKTEKEEE